MHRSPPLPRRTRRFVLLAVLVAQTGWFAWFMHRPPAGVADPGFAPDSPLPHSITADYPRYEVPAWWLATGHALSLSVTETQDPEVQGWVCTRHPDACSSDGMHPSALYPPGYSIFVAGIYKIFGRDIRPVIAMQFLLLLVMFIAFELTAVVMLDRAGYWFAMCVAASYPFLALYAVLFSTEHLHNVLFLVSLAALLRMRPSLWRGVAFGGLFGLATLVRPYTVVVFPVLWLWPSVWRGVGAGWRERFVAGLLFALPFVIWTGRNYYWFGKVIPITTGGPGVLLMHTTLEWELDPYAKTSGFDYYAGLSSRIEGLDVSTHEGEKRLRHLAFQRMRDNPGKTALTILKHIPKLWVSVGTTAAGVSRAWLVLLVYLGGLWLLGLWGGWVVRHDARWHVLLLSIGVYWAFLLYTPGEARRTLALRLPMLLLASVAASHVWAWRAQRRTATTEASAV
ncbi:MAG: hypothetical protein JWN44_4161 [Myxococcales bacterium]|nr:hypothetical protein [Myxococcales bacterium]